MDIQIRAALAYCLEHGLTFAIFSRPGDAVTLWAQRTPEVERVEGALLWELNDVFLIAPFELDPEHLAFIRSDVELTFSGVAPEMHALHECVGRSMKQAPAPVPSAEEEFKRSISDAQQLMIAGGLEKVVLSRLMFQPVDHTLIADLFITAVHARRQSLVALIHTPDHGTWLGASPERLVVEEEDHVWVDALAGTMPAEVAPDDARHWSEKERGEQEFVSRHVLNVFNSLGLSGIAHDGPEVVTYGEVAHLRTTFEAELGDRTLSELLLALHPTPALCGTPTDIARAFIRANESHERELYGGAWGPWKPDGRTDLYANIRCLKVVQGGVAMFVGAGVTKGSSAHEEWLETEQKARTWLDLIREVQ